MSDRTSNSRFPDPDSPTSLPRLAGGIARLESGHAKVPTEFDFTMSRAIQNHFAQRADVRRRRWRIASSIGGGLAAAATVTFALVVPWSTTTPPASPNLARTPAGVPVPPASMAVHQVAGDMDRNGRIDILDAFALARELEVSHEFEPQQIRLFDLNIDGHVDRRDVDLIAQQAVAINKPASGIGGAGGRSS